MFCRQDFFDLKSQMLSLQVSLAWMALGKNCIANLCSLVYQPSITQESTHVYLPQTDLQHVRSAPGLGSEPEHLDLIYSTK